MLVRVGKQTDTFVPESIFSCKWMFNYNVRRIVTQEIIQIYLCIRQRSLVQRFQFFIGQGSLGVIGHDALPVQDISIIRIPPGPGRDVKKLLGGVLTKGRGLLIMIAHKQIVQK